MTGVRQKLDRTTAACVLVDLQERLVPAIAGSDEMVANAARLARAAGLLDVPVYASEQYPKGLGRTVAAVADALPEKAGRVEKTAFSCLDDPSFVKVFDHGRDQVVLGGIEAHVCVAQTALDFVNSGVDVFVVADAVGSRTGANKDAALARLQAAGASVVTTEMVLFEWLRGKDHPQFKAVQALVK